MHACLNLILNNLNLILNTVKLQLLGQHAHMYDRSNNGYCGETSLIQSAMAYGTWSSQFNVRSIATTYGSSVTQTGVANGATPKLLSQMLLDPPGGNPGNSFEQAVKNFKLVGNAYPSASQTSGLTVSPLLVQLVIVNRYFISLLRN